MLNSLKAVGVGILIETLGFIGWYAALHLLEFPLYIRDAAAYRMLYNMSAYAVVVGLAQLAFVFLGGFAAGSVAKSRRVGHGVLVGLIGIAVVWVNYPPPPLRLVFFAISALPTATGGALVAQANARKCSKVAGDQYRP